MPKKFKTRPFSSPNDWNCPKHSLPVKRMVRMVLDHEAEKRYGGEFYGCPQYGKCGYYVSPGDGKRPPMVAVIEE